MADRLNADGPVRLMAAPDVGPSCGNDTSVPGATVAALSGGINAKKSEKSMVPLEPGAPGAPGAPVRRVVLWAQLRQLVPRVRLGPAVRAALARWWLERNTRSCRSPGRSRRSPALGFPRQRLLA